MSKLTKNQKLALGKIEAGKAYTLKEASALVKEITTTKFDASVDVDVRLGVDPRKANQMVRGVVSLPHGTGKQVRVLALCTPDKEAEATAAGADYVGLDEYIEKIKGGWTDIDVIITMPSIMGKIGALGRVLGPRGLMPNPKSGTVTNEIGNAVKEVKQGKIDFKVDKSGIVHTSIGKISFNSDQIRDNAKEFISTLLKLKPSAAKGTYIKSIYLSSTMSAGIKIDPKSVEDKGLIIGQLTEIVKEYPNFYLTDIEALDAEKTSKLRRECFKKEIKLVVVKNNLLKKALENVEGDFSPLQVAMKGNTAVMFSQTANAPARLIKEFTKDAKKDAPVKPELKAAYVQESFYIGAENLEALVNIKSKNELIGDVIMLLQSPAKNVISALQSSGQTIHGLLKTLEER